MGSRIAAHFANAGVPSYLLDLPSPGSARNKIATTGLELVKKSKPAAFFEPSLAGLVKVGNFEDDLGKLAEVDWILEAVVENLESKRSLLRKVEVVRRPGTIVTTNTSGLPVGKIAEGMPEEFRRCWFGTHFFNPPRYMRLLEIIPTPDTDPALVEAVSWFSDVRLGKGVVKAKDTPNFIANRIGTFSVLSVMRLMQELDLTVEEVDALTGPALGWPKSATYRTLDMVGLDVLQRVVSNAGEESGCDGGLYAGGVPEFVTQMVSRNWLGDKTRSGFYKKIKSSQSGEDERLVLDWKTLEYRPLQKPKLPPLEMAKSTEDTASRIRMLLSAEGVVGKFLWAQLAALWNYTADCIPEISDSIADVDRAMRLGFNWELGPFALWDAAGVEGTVARMKKEGNPVAANADRLLASGKKSWYAEATGTAASLACWDVRTGSYEPVQVPDGVWSVGVAKKSNGVVKRNAGASLVDLGDGVGGIEFHSKMNTLGSDAVGLVSQSLKAGGSGDGFDAFVICNDAPNFSAGANLMLLLLSAQEEEWEEVDLAVRQFQNMTQAIKFSSKPVVIAPFGMTLGGGAEMTLHAAARQPHAELYIGLVEVGVGLLPGGGGCKEMLLRAIDSVAAARSGKGSGVESVELLEAMKRTFEIIATAKVATSAAEARGLGFLTEADSITMNRERLLADAKARALELVRSGYEPPLPRSDIPAPGENVLAALKLGVHLMRQGEFITEYEAMLGSKIAEVLCGGTVTGQESRGITPGTVISEQYLLDLEREAFKSLCGERKTQERIQYTLKTGKTLRN